MNVNKLRFGIDSEIGFRRNEVLGVRGKIHEDFTSLLSDFDFMKLPKMYGGQLSVQYKLDAFKNVQDFLVKYL